MRAKCGSFIFLFLEPLHDDLKKMSAEIIPYQKGRFLRVLIGQSLNLLKNLCIKGLFLQRKTDFVSIGNESFQIYLFLFGRFLNFLGQFLGIIIPAVANIYNRPRFINAMGLSSFSSIPCFDRWVLFGRPLICRFSTLTIIPGKFHLDCIITPPQRLAGCFHLYPNFVPLSIELLNGNPITQSKRQLQLIRSLITKRFLNLIFLISIQTNRLISQLLLYFRFQLAFNGFFLPTVI